jgi:hypothetical protein
MSEEAAPDGQAEVTKSPMELALSAATSMLEKEEGKAPEKPEAKPEPEKEEAKPEAKEEAKAPVEETQENAPKFKAKVKYKNEDGADEEREVDEDELVKGFMLEKDYRRKTAQLAKQRETVEAEVKKSLETKAKEYDEKLQLAEQAIWHTLVPELKSIDFNKLAKEDPARWAQEYQRVTEVNHRLAQIQAQRKELAEASQRQQQESLQKQAREAIETLQVKIPGWSNDLYTRILKSAGEYGFKPDEVGAIVDPRAIEVLNDARQWRELKAKPVVEKRVAEKPKAVIKPGVAQDRPNPNAEARKLAEAQFRKTGRRDDAVAFVAQLLESEAR